MKADLGLDWLKPIANGKESGMLSIKKQKSLKINNRVLSAFCKKQEVVKKLPYSITVDASFSTLFIRKKEQRQ